MNQAQLDFENLLFSRYPELLPLREALHTALDGLRAAYDSGGKVLVCGNGGSAADSEHIVGELMKGFLRRRPLTEEQRAALIAAGGSENMADSLQQGLPAISLVSQSGVISAFANDVDPDMIFAQQTFAYGNSGDVLIALSTSGNSANVVNAVIAGKAKGMFCIGITGEKESRLSALCSVCFRTPTCETYQVQEYTLPLYHTLCAMTEFAYFDR